MEIPKLVSFKICPFVQRARAILELKKVDYDIEYISLDDKPEWFLKKSPHGKVPILITKQGTLFESNAISEYLDEIFPENKLHPEDPFERAKQRAWIELAVKCYSIQHEAQKSPESDTLAEWKIKSDQELRKISEALVNKPYFSGNVLRMIDAAWFVFLHRTEVFRKYSGFDFLDGHEKLKEWRASLLGEPVLLKSVSDDFEEAFTDYYPISQR